MPDEERRLAADVVDLQVQVAQLSQEMVDLSYVRGGDAGSGPASTLFTTVDDWVDSYFIPVFRRPLGGEFRWCARWFEHAEARERLDALWRSWEALRVNEPTGMATWLTSLLDPQLPILMGSRGPFHGCTPDRHAAELAAGSPSPAVRGQAPASASGMGSTRSSAPPTRSPRR